jgi:hypothetical protein
METRMNTQTKLSQNRALSELATCIVDKVRKCGQSVDEYYVDFHFADESIADGLTTSVFTSFQNCDYQEDETKYAYFGLTLSDAITACVNGDLVGDMRLCSVAGYSEIFLKLFVNDKRHFLVTIENYIAEAVVRSQMLVFAPSQEVAVHAAIVSEAEEQTSLLWNNNRVSERSGDYGYSGKAVLVDDEDVVTLNKYMPKVNVVLSDLLDAGNYSTQFSFY